MNSNDDIVKEIFIRLRRQMNGAVAGAMRDYSPERGFMNYGVSLPTIKKITDDFEKNQTLAKLLYSKEVRELKIAGIYLAEPYMINIEEACMWIEESPSFEISDILAKSLLSKTSIVEDIFRECINDTPQKINLALMTLSHYIKDGIKRPNFCDEAVVRKILSLTENQNNRTFRASIFALSSIAKDSPTLRNIIVSEATKSELLKEELLWQIE